MLRRVVEELQQQAGPCASELNIGQALPYQYALMDIAEGLSECNPLPRHDVFKAISLCLKNSERIQRVPQDDEPVSQLVNHAVGFLNHSNKPSHGDPRSVDEALHVLRCLVVDFSALLTNQDLICVAAFVDSQDAWTTQRAESNARNVLEHVMRNGAKHVFITSTVLEDFIRPIFSRTISGRITSSGRKAHYIGSSQDHAAQDSLLSTGDTKPWKTDQIHAITIFAWAVEQSNEVLISKNWPLFTPVLLALMDDTDVRFKARGLVILRNFLTKCPASVLNDTGLGEIFEQSVFPSLLSLPTLTPEDESLLLLDPAYNAVIQLANAQFPDEQNRPQKTRLLGRLLREGIFSGYWHASEYVRVVELLARQTTPIVRQLGAFTIPHLKELLSMFAAIMTDPFLASCPTCIQAAAQALSSILLNCWPRMSHASHAGEMLRTISVCWLNVRDECAKAPNNAANEMALGEVSRLATLLRAILTASDLPPQQHLSLLCAAEPRLVELFERPEVTLDNVRGEDKGELSQVAAA